MGMVKDANGIWTYVPDSNFSLAGSQNGMGQFNNSLSRAAQGDFSSMTPPQQDLYSFNTVESAGTAGVAPPTGSLDGLPFWGGDSWMENGLQGLQMLNAGMNLWGAPAAHRAAMRNINTDTQLAAQRRDSLAQQSAENAAKHSAIMNNVEARRKASLAGMTEAPM